MFKKFLGALVAATALALAVPGIAAADGRVWSEASGHYYAAACDLYFVDYGEHLYLTDDLADGSGCYGEYSIGYATFEMFNSNGSGTVVHKDLDMIEGAIISLRVCARDDGIVIYGTCSPWLITRA